MPGRQCPVKMLRDSISPLHRFGVHACIQVSTTWQRMDIQMLNKGKAHGVRGGAGRPADALAQRLRPLDLSGIRAGKLFLAAMPGRNSDMQADLAHMAAQSVTSILCLAEHDETSRLSPDYARLWGSDRMPELIIHPIPDLGVPHDIDAYRATVAATSERLKDGETVLIHCAAGIGRTGMTAIGVLCALGMDAQTACARVEAAGSGPETAEQREFLQKLVRGC